MREASDDQVQAAETYHRLFVPAEFAEWAPRVVAAAGVLTGQRVLDIACGTGVLAREALRKVGPAGIVTGLDPDAGMVTVAARLSRGVHWQRGDATSLPYKDQSFDAVLSQFGLMYFPDRRRALREMMRVTRPAGRLVVAVWASLEQTPAYRDFVAVLEETAGAQAADALRRPFALGDAHELTSLFADAGIPDIAITTILGTGRFASLRAMVEAELRGWMPLVGITMSDTEMHSIIARAQHVLSRYVVADGSIRFEAPAHIAAATKQ